MTYEATKSFKTYSLPIVEIFQFSEPDQIYHEYWVSKKYRIIENSSSLMQILVENLLHGSVKHLRDPEARPQTDMMSDPGEDNQLQQPTRTS